MTSGELLPNTSAKRRGIGRADTTMQTEMLQVGGEPEGGRAKPALRLLAFSFEVGIRHDGATFNTAHLASLVFFFRDAIGYQATVGTGARGVLREWLWGLI